VGESIGIAGAGRIGQALGRLLLDLGQPVSAVASRHAERAAEAARFIGGTVKAVSYRSLPEHASRILVAVPDGAISCVARALVKGGMRSGLALHTSGSQGADALAPLIAAGVACGALHPLQTVASPVEGLRALAGVTFAIDGEGDAGTWAEQIVGLLGGRVLRIGAASRPIYHAAAVMASNYVVALLASAVMLMKEAGVEESAAWQALAPLARTSLENVLRMGPAALTGPVERGDSGTVRSHLLALERVPASVRELYRAAGLTAVEIARDRGLPEARAVEILHLLRKGAQDA
jgi:predicted short-subunit dehydrogenase-like oxidoreductase (DUF2520 family)